MSLAISIVTPSLNQGRFIEQTIISVLNQGVSGLEYLVVDGGSTDETLEILARYRGRVAWVSEKDHGQADAVNKGWRATSAPVVGWLNSDDIYYPGALRVALDFFAGHPDADVVYGDAFHIDETGQELDRYYTEPWSFERLAEVCFLCQPAVFLRRRVLERCGFLDQRLRYAMDYEYWLRLGLQHVRFAYIPRVLAGSRLYAQNKTLGSRVAVHAEINTVLRRRLGRVPERWLFNYAHARADEWGIERSTMRFRTAIAAISLWASVRWNRGVSGQVWRTTQEWLRDGVYAKLSGTLPR